MFQPAAMDLFREVEESEKVRDDHLEGVNQIIREYVGRWYNKTADDIESNPEPYSYAFISNILPALIYENPSVIVKARRVIGHRMVSEAMQSGIKGWLEDVPFKEEVERVVLDFLFFQGVLMHYLEDDTRWSAGAVRPNVFRVDPRHFGVDSLCDHVDHAEFMFHSYWVDHDDLLADPAVLPDALARIQARQGSTEEEDKKGPFKMGDAASLKRRRVKVYSIWSRRSNTIRVMAKEPQALELYQERPYYGPYCGPYSVFQAYPVPGRPYPLSPLIAIQDQVLDLQVHARAAGRSAAGRKTVVIVDGTLGTLAEDLADAEDREVISVPGFNASQAQQLEFGGMSSGQYEHLGFLRDRVDRTAGLTQNARGQVGQADSATEAQIASEALNNRTEYLKGKVRSGVGKSLKSVGWFLFHTPGVIIPVTSRDPITGMESEGLFFGGPQQGQEMGSWEDYAIHIEPLSMQRVSETTIQRRAMDFANFIISVAPLMPQIPWVRWMEVIRMVGESMNQENTDTFLIPEMLGMMSQPDFQAVSGLLGGPQDPGERYSIPGQGFKSRMGAEENSNASPSVDDRRAGFGKTFGPMGGGLQGPPGSAD